MSRETAKLINPQILIKEVEFTPIGKLAKKYNVNPTTIIRKLAKANYSGKKTGRPNIRLNKDKLSKDLNSYSIMELAPLYNISYSTLCKYIKEFLPDYKIKRGRRKKKKIDFEKKV